MGSPQEFAANFCRTSRHGYLANARGPAGGLPPLPTSRRRASSVSVQHATQASVGRRASERCERSMRPSASYDVRERGSTLIET